MVDTSSVYHEYPPWDAESLRSLRHLFDRRAKIVGSVISSYGIQELWDVGCGEALLKRYLSPSITYRGYDVVPLPGVEYADLTSTFPDWKPPPNSALSMIGVVEILGWRLINVLSWAVGRFTYVFLTHTESRSARVPKGMVRYHSEDVERLLGMFGRCVVDHAGGKWNLYRVSLDSDPMENIGNYCSMVIAGERC